MKGVCKEMNTQDLDSIMQLSDESIAIKLNQIERKKCRFGTNVEELEQEKELLINELKRREYMFVNVDVN